MRIRACLAAASILASAHVQAQTVTVTGDTTGGPTWNRPFLGGGFSGACTACNYDTVAITIVDPANFRAETVGPFVYDTYLHLYEGSFDPASPHVNLVATDDDGGSGLQSQINTGSDGPFNAGSHVVVVSAFADGQFGTYILELDGTGTGVNLGNELSARAAGVAFLVSDARFGKMGQIGAESLNARRNFTANTATTSNINAHRTVATSHGQLANGFHGWVDAGYKTSRGNSAGDASLHYAQFGFDVAIDPDMVLGIAVGIGAIDSSNGIATLEGTGYWIQPYAAFDFGFLRGSVSVAIGANDYDTFTFLGTTGSARGDGGAVNVFLAHDVTFGEAMVVSPYIRASAGHERLASFSGALAGTPSNDIQYLDSALGVEVRRFFTFGAGPTAITGSVFARAEGEYRFADSPAVTFGSGPVDYDGISAGFALGASVDIADDVSFSFELSTDGVGADFTSYGGSGSLVLHF